MARLIDMSDVIGKLEELTCGEGDDESQVPFLTLLRPATAEAPAESFTVGGEAELRALMHALEDLLDPAPEIGTLGEDML